EGSVHHPIHNRARYAESSRLSAHANRVDQYVLASLITIQQSPDEGSVMTTSIEPDSRPVAPRVLARMASLLDIHGHGVGETREGVIVKIAQPSDRELAEWDSHEATWNLRGLCLRLAHERQEGVDHTEVHSDERAVQAGLAIATANTKPGCTARAGARGQRVDENAGDVRIRSDHGRAEELAASVDPSRSADDGAVSLDDEHVSSAAARGREQLRLQCVHTPLGARAC